jgi:MbtH protein
MQNDFDYKVLVNAEGQYSIWPEMKAAPLGWTETGPTGSKEEVLEWVKTTWTDMRPASLRQAVRD